WRISSRPSRASRRSAARTVGRLTCARSQRRRSLGRNSSHVPSLTALRRASAVRAASDTRWGISRGEVALLILSYQLYSLAGIERHRLSQNDEVYAPSPSLVCLSDPVDHRAYHR